MSTSSSDAIRDSIITVARSEENGRPTLSRFFGQPSDRVAGMVLRSAKAIRCSCYGPFEIIIFVSYHMDNFRLSRNFHNIVRARNNN